MVVLKTLVVEHAGAPNIDHPHVIKVMSTLDVTHVAKCTSLFLS